MEGKSKEEIIIETKNFFDSYKKEVGDSLRKGNKVIYLDFLKLSEFSSKLSDEILPLQNSFLFQSDLVRAL